MRANRSWETLENHDNSGGPTITLENRNYGSLIGRTDNMKP